MNKPDPNLANGLKFRQYCTIDKWNGMTFEIVRGLMQPGLVRMQSRFNRFQKGESRSEAHIAVIKRLGIHHQPATSLHSHSWHRPMQEMR